MSDAHMQRHAQLTMLLKDVGIESQELGDLPLAVRVETVVEKDKRMMVF